jgi:hypothetical protein
MAELERRLGLRDWIRRRRAKLPQANREVDTLTETSMAFQRRRVTYEVERLLDAGEPVTTWWVMRAVNVRRSHLAMVEKVIADTVRVWHRVRRVV